jgi:hypothetical protein
MGHLRKQIRSVNPRNWLLEHQLALGAACLLGALLFATFGFIHSGLFSLENWLNRNYWELWAAIGAVIFGLAFYTTWLLLPEPFAQKRELGYFLKQLAQDPSANLSEETRHFLLREAHSLLLESGILPDTRS